MTGFKNNNDILLILKYFKWICVCISYTKHFSE